MQQEVGVEDQLPLRDDARLQGANCSCRSVARVDGGRQTLGHALLVHLDEGCLWEDNFASDFEVLRQARGFQLCCGDAKRDGADGADVGGDIFADSAIAAREAALEFG